MNINEIENKIKKKITNSIEILPEGNNRYQIFTPFRFSDGDHIVSILKKMGSKWIITDEGHTCMHLSYDIDINSLKKGTRLEIIDSILIRNCMKDNNGEFVVIIENGDYGNALYSFIQGVLQIFDILYLKRDRVVSTFVEDFKLLIKEKIPENRRTFDYYNFEHDPEKKYAIDCKINNMKKPLFLFAIGNDDKCRDTTIILNQFEKWNIPFQSMSIFENQENINRKVLARFSDISEKQFSNLYSNKDRIEKYLLTAISS